ncbi:MAG: class I SAM-dependent methyltransferase [Lachnospiraceae bacterium]|nr:class I SAM-dependent methyltransferase [Lachnospiraceae bacterium]
MGNTYTDALKFWNSAFMMDDESKEEFIKDIDIENGWKDLASSEKLSDVIVRELADKSNVLDYGCGEGWAGIVLNKSGCKKVTCVDVVENAIELANFLKNSFKIESGLTMQHVSDTWIKEVDSKTYDGVFCSNVIDVLPKEVSDEIIENIARIATDDAKIVIAMNYYTKAESNPEKHLEVKNGNELYVDGILRMISRSDEEWTEIFNKYFTVERIEYFAWPGETEEKRRIFIMKKRK